jgi:AcrR family transcriptional regulator
MPRRPVAGRKDQLLHVAAAEFAARGYSGASMRRIAARWGVKPAALYYWFPSKPKLLEAICRYGIAEFVQRLEAVVALDLPAEERVRRAVRAHLEPLLEKRFYVHAFLFQRRDLPDRARYPLDAQSRAYEALWRALLEEGKREGTIPATLDSQLAVQAVLGMCNSVARWPHGAAGVPLDQVAKTFAQLICHGLFERREGAARLATMRPRTRRR